MEAAATDRVRAELMESSEEFRKLADQHSVYDRRLGELASRKFPSQEEQTEEARLKKMKLHFKDQMEHMMLSQAQKAG